MDLPFEIWDVFTDRPFTGNPLAIVDCGQAALDGGAMQTLARQFNLSETIFLMPPREAAHTARARIFFPTGEIPFAGHPTIGAATLLAKRHRLEEVLLEEEAGLVRVTTRFGMAQLTAPVLPHGHEGEISAEACAAALGLEVAEIGPHRPGLFAGGPSFAYIPVTTREALARARPQEPAWSALMEAGQVDAGWLYDPDFNARLFAPSAGIPEDPATGSACAVLAAQLMANGALPDGTTRLTISQGEDMGRPSVIGFEAAVIGGALQSVKISGRAVPVAKGQIRVP